METKGAIVVLDFGGQYAHLIARRVRQCGCASVILPPETPASELTEAAGIILSGGPQSVYADDSPQADRALLELDIPVLGLCYGMQWMALALGGEVKPGHIKEYGRTSMEIVDGGGALLHDLGASVTVWMSHGDEVAALPDGFAITGQSDSCKHAAMEHAGKKLFAFQYHPEVVHTEHGDAMIARFVERCAATPWSVESYAKRIGEEILAEVGDRNVFMLVSGGVDSTVAFTLLTELLGADRVQGLLVDTGLMRKNEVLEIQQAFDALDMHNLAIEDASDTFFAALDGLVDPEAKRRAIGDTFLAVQKTVSERMNLRAEDGWMLGQGTIYPDTIETGGTKHADHIKTHHNRVPAIDALIEQGLVIEPLKDLYKDEVRTLGEELGLPHDLVHRHPFPGPGLGVRMLCSDGTTDLDDRTIPDINLSHTVLPVYSVGVQGDGRTYRHPLAVFSSEPCVITEEEWQAATALPNKHAAINRVVKCVSHTSNPSFVLRSSVMTQERADLLREADAIVTEEMRRGNLYEAIWQFPVVLLPLGLEGSNSESILLRPVHSQEAMTAHAASLPADVLQRMTERILALPGIEAVFYDLTSKPPGTIEWE